MPSVTFSSVLQVRPSTVMFLARLLQQRREAIGTRTGRRALSPWSQAVPVLRWFLDGTRIRQLAADCGIGLSTCYRYLHEGIAVLALAAPDIREALMAVVAFGATHVNLDGTLIVTDRLAARGPNGADLWWSGKHKCHGGNIQVLCLPCGFPIWVSDVRPGREHDTTCAKAAEGLLPALKVLDIEERIPTLTDLGYVSVSPAIRHPHKKPKGGELTEAQTTYNKVIRGVHGIGERANSLLKTTFKALRRVSLCPWRIGAITRAALVLLHLEHDRLLPGGHPA
jgi:DDE superfamily endonuclease